MKIQKSLIVILVLMLGHVLVEAQTFSVLHAFSATYTNSLGKLTNVDGGRPVVGLVRSGNTLFGTALYNGPGGAGTVFRVNTDGTGFTNLHSFSPVTGTYPNYVNAEGANPHGALCISGNALYGTTMYGGSSGRGVIFKINADGSGFTNLHSLNGSNDGANPYSGLTLVGDRLFGVTTFGGANNRGTIFSMKTNGSGFTVLHPFTVNPDEAYPYASLTFADGILYGSTDTGGSGRMGTLFAIRLDGSGYTNLYHFSYPTGNNSSNGDGARANGDLCIISNRIYGTTYLGGGYGYGNVFRMNVDGTGFTNLHNFDPQKEGGQSRAGLVLFGNTLYGVTSSGLVASNGAVFSLNIDDGAFKILHTVPNIQGPLLTNRDGAALYGTLVLFENAFYGTAYSGGEYGAGTVFRVSLSAPNVPSLSLAYSGGGMVLTWPTNEDSLVLQAAPEPTGTFTNVGVVTSPYTNAVTGEKKFFRLKSN